MKKKIIVILSGKICTGKSTLADGLVKKYGFHFLSTSEALKDKAKGRFGDEFINNRTQLMDYGRKLDESTGGEWVVKYLQGEIAKHDRIIVDSVRIQAQLTAFRSAFDQCVIHVHLKAPDDWRFIQYKKRRKNGDFKTIKEAKEKFKAYNADATEAQVDSLVDNADIIVYSADTSSKDDNVVKVASFLKLLPLIRKRNVDVIVGGQFGSEGKGQIAAYLSPEYDALIRVGGPNAGHKVFEHPDPHVFHIIPSGTVRSPESQIIIGPGAVLNKETLLSEISGFEVDSHRIVIDKNATIISTANINREKKLDKIGSTTTGVGLATSENIVNRLRGSRKFKADNHSELKQYIGDAHEAYENIHASGGKLLLEGTQGTLLSLHHGLYPYVTSRDTTVSGCLAEAGIGPGRVRKIIMVTRRYPIRVKNPENGTSGDFLSEEITLKEIQKRSGFPLKELELLEITSTTRRKRRIAEFNWELFRKACELNTPTDIALTFADYISYENQKARRYGQLTLETTNFVEELEKCSGVNVSLIATRFEHRAIIDRRNWK